MLTSENYYSPESNQGYMSASQFKSFLDCEARTLAELHGEYHRPSTEALLVGSYVDAYFEGTLDDAECMKLIGIARGTYYKYKREIKKDES